MQRSFFDISPLPYLILQGAALHIIQANTAAVALLQHAAEPTLSFNHFLKSNALDAYGLLKKFAVSEPLVVLLKTGSGITAMQLFCSVLSEGELLFAIQLVPALATQVDEGELLIADMLDDSSDVLTAADLNFRPLTWSKAAERLYGITRQQAIGQNLRQYLDIEYQGTEATEVRRQALELGLWRGEMTLIRPTDGKKLTLLITFKLIKDAVGNPQHYVVSGADISDRKAAEAKLQESENRFREVADSAPVGIWMSELENKVIYINKPLADYIGMQAEVFTEGAWISLIHPNDRDEVLKKFYGHLHSQKSLTLVYRIRHCSGHYRWVQNSGTPRCLSNGVFLGYIGSVVDIHDTKQRETQLQYQALLMDHVLDSVITTDLDHYIQSCNPVAADIYGRSEAQLLGKRLHELIPLKFVTDTWDDALATFEATGLWNGEVNIDVRGEERNFYYTVRFITNSDGERVGIMAMGREITDQKRAERNLQQSEAFYRNLIADSVDGKLLTDSGGTISFASLSIQGILGYAPEELVGHNAFEFVHPDDHPVAMHAFELELQQNPEVKFIEVRLLKRDGTWLWCSVRGHNLLANPHIASMVISLHDDTQRKKATDALKESEQRFRNLIKDLKLGVTLQDADGNVLLYNKAMADLLHLCDTGLYMQNLYGLLKKMVHEDETPYTRADWPVHRAAQTKKPVQDVLAGIQVADGADYVWLLVNANPVLNEDGSIRHIIASFTDVTEHKKLSQRLLEERLNQQRLLTQATIDGQERERKEIGKELHDNIGQQLATAKLYLDLAKEAPGSQEMLSRATKSIVDVINEVRNVSHSLVPPTLGDLGLIDSIQELVQSIGLVQRLHINFTHRQFDESALPENGKLMLYRIMQEALNNIIKHAQATTVHITLARSLRGVSLEIRDNGCGFAPEKIRKGLGLTNIRNRAELFGGTVRIHTAPGRGCTLSILIPNKSIARLQAV